MVASPCLGARTAAGPSGAGSSAPRSALGLVYHLPPRPSSPQLRSGVTCASHRPARSAASAAPSGPGPSPAARTPSAAHRDRRAHLSVSCRPRPSDRMGRAFPRSVGRAGGRWGAANRAGSPRGAARSRGRARERDREGRETHHAAADPRQHAVHHRRDRVEVKGERLQRARDREERQPGAVEHQHGAAQPPDERVPVTLPMPEGRGPQPEKMVERHQAGEERDDDVSPVADGRRRGRPRSAGRGRSRRRWPPRGIARAPRRRRAGS